METTLTVPLEQCAVALANDVDQKNAAEIEAKKVFDDWDCTKSTRVEELSKERKKCAELDIEKKETEAKIVKIIAELEVIVVKTADAEKNYGLARSAAKSAKDIVSKLLNILSRK